MFIYSIYAHINTIMRTTIDLPEDLLSEAVVLTGSKTKTAAIITALKMTIAREKMRKLKKYRGKIGLSIDMDVLRKR